jgi:hypothetical protein
MIGRHRPRHSYLTARRERDLDNAVSEFCVARDSPVGPSSDAGVVRLVGMHPLRLAALDSIMTGRPTSAAVAGALTRALQEASSGPWTYRLAPEFVSALVTVTDYAAAHTLAVAWADTSAPGPRPPARVDELTVEILLLARLARLTESAPDPDVGLWCWTTIPVHHVAPRGWPLPSRRRRSPR